MNMNMCTCTYCVLWGKWHKRGQLLSWCTFSDSATFFAYILFEIALLLLLPLIEYKVVSLSSWPSSAACLLSITRKIIVGLFLWPVKICNIFVKVYFQLCYVASNIAHRYYVHCTLHMHVELCCRLDLKCHIDHLLWIK